jgi:hypothetical protein
MRGCGSVAGAGSSAAAPRIELAPAIAIPRAINAPMTDMIASILGDVDQARNVGSVRHRGCEAFHTLKQVFSRLVLCNNSCAARREWGDEEPSLPGPRVALRHCDTAGSCIDIAYELLLSLSLPISDPIL